MILYKKFALETPNIGQFAPDIPLLFGCEYEIEHIAQLPESDNRFHTTEDGSLRNGGREFVTRPLSLQQTLEMFVYLHTTSGLVYGNEAFSPRTSIHVHVNCCNLEVNVVRNILLLYALFEECFFSLVSPERRDNIHCVALTDTFLPSIYRAPLPSLVTKWHKYTALNIKPLSTQGTIEFRHMHGHNNISLFTQWIGAIDKLFSTGKTFSVNKRNLTEENIYLLFTEIFAHTDLMSRYPYLRANMNNQLLDVKLSSI